MYSSKRVVVFFKKKYCYILGKGFNNRFQETLDSTEGLPEILSNTFMANYKNALFSFNLISLT